MSTSRANVAVRRTDAPGALAARLTWVASLGGFLFGYDTAVISGAVSSIEANFIAPLDLPETARNALSGFTVSSALVGCVIGASIAGWLCNAYGRRGGLIIAAALFVFSAIGSALPELVLGPVGQLGADALAAFNVYRILCGTAIGIASMLSPLYIAEIAPPASRGRLVSYNQMAIVIGIVSVYFVNWLIAAQGDDAWLKSVGWRLMLGSGAVPAIVFLLLLLRVPDTPRWLVLKGRTEAAHDVLRRIGVETQAGSILAEIQATLAERSDRILRFGWRLIVIGVLLSVFQQLVGINAVLYYAPRMFENLGATTGAALLQTVVIGVANVIFTLVAIFTVDRIGRKPLLVAGAAVMAAAMITLGLLFARGSMGIAALVALMVFIAAFACSWGPVVWVLLAEMFPNSIRHKAMSIAVAAQWIANFLVSWSFRVLDGNATLNALFNHAFAYWLYGAMSMIAGIFVLRFVPETKSKTLEAMEGLWRR